MNDESSGQPSHRNPPIPRSSPPSSNGWKPAGPSTPAIDRPANWSKPPGGNWTRCCEIPASKSFCAPSAGTFSKGAIDMEEGFFTSERNYSEPVVSGTMNGSTLNRANNVVARPFSVFHEKLQLTTSERLQFIDITEQVIALANASGIQNGTVNIQTRHTTTAIVVNEAEPLLLEDMKKTLDRIAPPDQYYGHNDFSIRTVNMEEEETG